MNRSKVKWWWRWALAPLVQGLLSATAWAASPALGKQHRDFPCGSIPLPPGNHVRDWVNGQALKAELDDFVLYKYEFCRGKEKLGPYGSAHIQMIARRLATVPFPVIVQATIQKATYQSDEKDFAGALATLKDTLESIVIELDKDRIEPPERFQPGLQLMCMQARVLQDSGDTKAAIEAAKRVADLDPKGTWGIIAQNIIAESVTGGWIAATARLLVEAARSRSEWIFGYVAPNAHAASVIIALSLGLVPSTSARPRIPAIRRVVKQLVCAELIACPTR